MIIIELVFVYIDQLYFESHKCKPHFIVLSLCRISVMAFSFVDENVHFSHSMILFFPQSFERSYIYVHIYIYVYMRPFSNNKVLPYPLNYIVVDSLLIYYMFLHSFISSTQLKEIESICSAYYFS